MKMRLFKAATVKELIDHISENLDIYRSGAFDYLKVDSTNYFEISLDADEDKLSLIDCEGNDDKEVENCIVMYKAMGDLTNYLARDERLWVYLTHTFLLPYTIKRWPIPNDDTKAVKHIRNHFFVVGARGYERDNSASRLWWMASLCNRVDGLSLEKALSCLLHQYDVRASIIERPTTSQSIPVFSAILRRLSESFDGDRSLFERERFRSAMRNLNLVGGTKLLGAMDDKDIEKVIDVCF